MASKDFKSNQIRTTKLIASGAISGGGANPNNNIGIAVYSASIASDIAGGITDTKFLDKVGPDVMMVISGNIGGTDASTGFGPSGTEPGGITLFTGDVFTSGSLGMGKISSAPGTIGDNSLALYAKDDAGSTKLFYKHGTTEVGPLGSGGGGGGYWTQSAGEIYPTTLANNVGIGLNTGIGEQLHVQNAGGPQLRLSYDPTNYTNFKADASGNLKIDLGKSNRIIYMQDPVANDGQIYFKPATGLATVWRANNTTYSPPKVEFLKREGNLSVNSENLPNDTAVGYLHFTAGVGSNALIKAVTEDLCSSTSQPARLSFATTPVGATISKERLVIKSDGMTLIQSGTFPNANGLSEVEYPDTNFFVSGSIGSRGTTTKGTAVFGGDTMISGSCYGAHRATFCFNINCTTNGYYYLSSDGTAWTSLDYNLNWQLPYDRWKFVAASVVVGAADAGNPFILNIGTGMMHPLATPGIAADTVISTNTTTAYERVTVKNWSGPNANSAIGETFYMRVGRTGGSTPPGRVWLSLSFDINADD
jgi:hypothetical protein